MVMGFGQQINIRHALNAGMQELCSGPESASSGGIKEVTSHPCCPVGDTSAGYRRGDSWKLHSYLGIHMDKWTIEIRLYSNDQEESYCSKQLENWYLSHFLQPAFTTAYGKLCIMIIYCSIPIKAAKGKRKMDLINSCIVSELWDPRSRKDFGVGRHKTRSGCNKQKK